MLRHAELIAETCYEMLIQKNNNDMEIKLQ